MDPVIQQWIAKLSPNKQELILSLRDVLLHADTGLTERIKWNNLTILRGKQNILFMYTFNTVEYVNVGFFDAVKLPDPKGLFEGTGESMRHVKVHQLKTMPAAQLRKWVKQSGKLV
jgi:hypothetical protein